MKPLGNVVMEKDGASKLERQENKYRSTDISKRRMKRAINNHKKKNWIGHILKGQSLLKDVESWDDR